MKSLKEEFNRIQPKSNKKIVTEGKGKPSKEAKKYIGKTIKQVYLDENDDVDITIEFSDGSSMNIGASASEPHTHVDVYIS